MSEAGAPVAPALPGVPMTRTDRTINRGGAVGGSSSTRPTRKTNPKPNTHTDKKARALDRVTAKLGGADKLKELQTKFEALNSVDSKLADGIVVGLLASPTQKFSRLELEVGLHVGAGRIKRLENQLKNPKPPDEKKRRPAAAHALSDAAKQAIKDFKDTFPLEDGYPCAHKRPQQYIIQADWPGLKQPGEKNIALTWTIVHADYVKWVTMNRSGTPTAKYSRFLQYFHYYFPGVHLERKAEDLCDACMTIDTRLLDSSLSEEERKELLEKKNMHLGAAITQRRAVSSAVHSFVTRVAPEQQLPQQILPDELDDDGEPPDVLDKKGHTTSRIICLIRIDCTHFVALRCVSRAGRSVQTDCHRAGRRLWGRVRSPALRH